MPNKLNWTNIDDIAYALAEAHPGVDPRSIRFTQLREMVEALDDFEAEPGHNVNEQILEAIQFAWHEEAQDIKHDEDDEGYTPPVAYKPE